MSDTHQSGRALSQDEADKLPPAEVAALEGTRVCERPVNFGSGIRLGLFADGFTGQTGFKGRTITVSPNGKLITSVLDEPLTSDDHDSERYGINYRELDDLTGKLLTLCDATFTDPVQRKAFKDRVKGDLRDWMQGIMREAQYDANPQFTGPEFIVGGVTGQPGWAADGDQTR